MAFEAASSSSSSLSLPKRYDVFISFRGEDTRFSFTGHLYKALCDKKIRTFTDDQELPKGDDISPSLLQAIEDSYICVVVFSENYASSKWCLDELVHILHCKRDQGQIVVPVFYKVDPSHVRKQSGLFEQAFERYEADPEVAQHKIQMWKQALHEAANVAGYDSVTFRHEYEMIEKIVKDIMHQLNHKYPPAELKGLIGIDDNCQKIEELLKEARTIGIWGMGGIGKSTVAKTIFSRYCSHYESSCFLENVREESENGGLAGVRHKFLLLLLNDKDICANKPTTFLESSLSRRKVLVVLDDVNTVEQLEYLVGEPLCFGQGSKILITTRDKHVLSRGVDVIYEVKELELHQSYQLFNLNAFNTDRPLMGYEELTEKAVIYAKGSPLALKVLGSYLRGRREVEWKSALRKLEKRPHQDIQKVLRLSYDGLDDEEKNIFLDIAFFLKGVSKKFVIYLLENCGFEGAAIGIQTLCDKALINVEDGMHVEMHDLIQEMGLQVSRDEPEKRSRLLDSKKIYDSLASNMGMVVLKTTLHCEGCINKIRRLIRNFEGVESLAIDAGKDLVTVKGTMDVIEMARKLKGILKRNVEVVPPKKEEPPPPMFEKSRETDGMVFLKIRLHCDDCIRKIQKVILKFKGVESVNFDAGKDLVTVKGTMDVKQMTPYLKYKLNSNVEVVSPKKKDDKKDKGEAKPAGGHGERRKMMGQRWKLTRYIHFKPKACCSDQIVADLR